MTHFTLMIQYFHSNDSFTIPNVQIIDTVKELMLNVMEHMKECSRNVLFQE